MTKRCVWLLYHRADLNVNRDFAALMAERGKKLGMEIQPVTLDELRLSMDGSGKPFLSRCGEAARPDAAISRMRDFLVSRHLEAMGVPVFNCARVCELCNDKRLTLQFLSGLPMPPTDFLTDVASPPAAYPLVVKPARSHGGDRVALVGSQREWSAAVGSILPQPALQQSVVKGAGRDLRTYVLFGEIVAGVLRTAKEGVVSNFKRGGRVEAHFPDAREAALVTRVVRRFEEAGAPLAFAGVDLLYGENGPVVGEVEDVVGSRMLYETSDMDIVALYLEGLSHKL